MEDTADTIFESEVTAGARGGEGVVKRWNYLLACDVQLIELRLPVCMERYWRLQG